MNLEYTKSITLPGHDYFIWISYDKKFPHKTS